MKNLKAKNWFFLILGAVGLVFFIVVAAILKEVWWLGLIGIALCVILILVALKPMFKANNKNAVVVEGTFLSIGMQNEYYTGGVFEVNGAQEKIIIPKDVFSAKRLAPGGKYKITYNSRNGEAISLERID